MFGGASENTTGSAAGHWGLSETSLGVTGQ